MRKLSAVVLFGSMLALSAPLFAQGNPPAKPSTGKQDLISRADTNGDGKVSKDEFLNYERSRAEKMFDRLDTNKDGFIERNELNARKKPRRK